jgi:TetR/AcrR family transcriptional regulator
VNSQFDNLKTEKKERIINAALKEFAQSGYEKASTNGIIKEAGIAKGSLFNYFNNKKELYLFLLDYVTKIIDEIYSKADWNETDFFKRMSQIGRIKFEIYKKYPQAFDFMKRAVSEGATEVRTEIEALTKTLISTGLERGYQNINFSKFRTDLDLEKVTKIINWTALGFAEEQRDKVNSFQDVTADVLDEWEELSNILKRCFYKQEYCGDD